MSKIRRTIKHVQHVARKIKPKRLTKAEIYDKKRRKRLCAVLMVVGYILMFGSFFGFFQYKFVHNDSSWLASLRPMSAAEREKSVILLGSLVYRHSMGYPAYCQSNGYKMTHYPQVFHQTFAPEIKVLSDILSKRGTNLNRFLPQVAQQAGPMAQQVIKIELQEFQKFIEGKAQNKKVSIKEVCALVDEHADKIVATSPSTDFKHIRELAQKLD